MGGAETCGLEKAPFKPRTGGAVGSFRSVSLTVMEIVCLQ